MAKKIYVRRDKNPFLSDSVMFSSSSIKLEKSKYHDLEYVPEETMEYKKFLEMTGIKLKKGEQTVIAVKKA